MNNQSSFHRTANPFSIAILQKEQKAGQKQSSKKKATDGFLYTLPSRLRHTKFSRLSFCQRISNFGIFLAKDQRVRIAPKSGSGSLVGNMGRKGYLCITLKLLYKRALFFYFVQPSWHFIQRPTKHAVRLKICLYFCGIDIQFINQ